MSESLVPVNKKEVTSPLIVDSGNFIDYLVGDSRFIYSKPRIAESLSLPFLTPALEELLSTTKEGYVFSDEVREKVAQTVDTKKEESVAPDVKEIREAISGSFSDLLNLKGSVERSRTLFCDGDDGSIRISDIKQHKFDRGSVDTMEIWERGDFPLMEMHTHPKNVLPSPVDYYRMLLRLGDSNFRLVPAAVVVCPDLQILAVATPETLLLTKEILDKRIASAEEQTAEEIKRLNTLNSRAEVIKVSTKLLQKNMNAFFAKQIENIDYYQKGHLTEEELKIFEENLHRSFSEKASKLTEKTGRIQKRALDKLFGYSRFLINQQLMVFAREMNVALYMSTNFADFRRFSA